MAQRSRKLPSWLANIDKSSSEKVNAPAVTTKVKGPTKRPNNGSPKRRQAGKTTKTKANTKLAFSDSEDEDTKDSEKVTTRRPNSGSPKRRQAGKTTKTKANTKLAFSDSEDEDTKDSEKVTLSVTEKEKQQRAFNTNSSATSKFAMNDGDTEVSEATEIILPGPEDTGGKASIVTGDVNVDNTPIKAPDTVINGETEQYFEQCLIKSSPVYEDDSEPEDTAAAAQSTTDETKPVEKVATAETAANDTQSGNDRSVEESANDTNDSNAPARQSCRYGSSCYRKNPQHLRDFSHPGDDDNIVDNRPECPYGTSCYRKNSLHRQHYKHTQTIQKPNQRKRQGGAAGSGDGSDNDGSGSRKPRQAKRRKATNDDDDDDDDYDYDDPFLNDGSSDDYAPTDSGSETDFSGAEVGIDEEEDDSKRTVKEAKRFVRKK